MKDYYSTLEVDQNATSEKIKEQHRILILAWHPDKFPDGEMRARANSKAQEINEAYSVLGDLRKRKVYDDEFFPQNKSKNYSSNHTTSNPASQSAPIPSDYGYCQSCGVPAELRNVRIYESIGIFTVRLSKEASGQFCKTCIDHYFWTMTGITIMFGWWGFLSLFLTPFLLLNNFFVFLTTRKLRRPPIQIISNPNPFWVFITISFIFIIGFFSITFANASQPTVVAVEKATVVAPTKTPLPKPTKIPTKIIPPTVSFGCIRWDHVTSNHIGQTKCVYGTVISTNWIGNNFHMNFSTNKKGFFLASGTFHWSENIIGNCYFAEGKIYQDTFGTPYINPGDRIRKCDQTMR